MGRSGGQRTPWTVLDMSVGLSSLRFHECLQSFLDLVDPDLEKMRGDQLDIQGYIDHLVMLGLSSGSDDSEDSQLTGV